MEIFSMLLGADNLRKLAVMVGVLLVGFGILYPTQKTLELNDQKIQLDESKQLNAVKLEGIKKEVSTATIITNSHTQKVKKLNLQKDSLLRCSFNDNVKYQLDFIQDQINTLDLYDESSLKETKQKLLDIETSQIKTSSLQKQIDNLSGYVTFYIIAGVVFVVLGGFFFVMGLRKWAASQTKSDDFKELEFKIKQEELIKAQKANQV
jgi:hypothetical protein